MFEFTQIGWFDPGSKRFCYTDEKEYDESQGRGRKLGYTHPVFSIDQKTADRLSVQLMPPSDPFTAGNSPVSDRYCPAGKIFCMHSYINDSGDKCCNPNYTELPVGIGVVVGASNDFPADEVCRWPSKKMELRLFS